MDEEIKDQGTSEETAVGTNQPTQVLEGTQPDATPKNADDELPTANPEPNPEPVKEDSVKEAEEVKAPTISNIYGVLEFLHKQLQPEAFNYFKQNFLK